MKTEDTQGRWGNEDQRRWGSVGNLEAENGEKFPAQLRNLLNSLGQFYYIIGTWKITFQQLEKMVEDKALTVKTLNINGHPFICSERKYLIPENPAICTLQVDNKKQLVFVYMGK